MTSGRALFQPRTLGTINSMDTEDTMAFLKEREAKLGAPMKFRTYCTWFAKLGGERRDYGVFLYTDGRTMVYEDFERDPMILGIPINRKRKEKYVKMEESFPVDSITDVQRVTRRSAEKSLEAKRDISRAPWLFSKAFCKLVTKISTADSGVIFVELMDHKAFVDMIRKFQKEA